MLCVGPFFFAEGGFRSLSRVAGLRPCQRSGSGHARLPEEALRASQVKRNIRDEARTARLAGAYGRGVWFLHG